MTTRKPKVKVQKPVKSGPWKGYVIFDGNIPLLVATTDEHDGNDFHWELPVYRSEADAKKRGTDVRCVELRIVPNGGKR